MMILECPHCQSCFTVEDWNKSPHRGDSMPESLEDKEEWDLKHSGIYDCPDCGEVCLTEDMNIV